MSHFHFHFSMVDEGETSRHWPIVTWSLALINIAVYAAMKWSDTDYDELVQVYSLTPASLQWWQFVSSSFMHANLFHLIANLVVLLILGDNVEDVVGPVPFLALYLFGGFAGDALMVLNNPGMAIPSLGASGCIATIAGAYAVLFWNSMILLDACFEWFSFEFPVPALLFLVFLMAADVALTIRYAAELGPGGGVNYVAHGVGFVVGIVAGVWVLNRGAVARYRKFRDGDLLLGYLPFANNSPVRPAAKARRTR